MKKFFGVMFLIISVSIIGCKKSDDKKSSENGISPANAAETKKSKNDVPDIPFPKTLEELEKIKDKITPQQYENAKNSLKAVQNREKILFSNWNEDQINFYKATKDYKPGDKKLDSKLTELYKKIPLASRFRQAYPFPMPETNLCSGKNSNGEDYECGGVNARNKNNTMDN